MKVGREQIPPPEQRLATRFRMKKGAQQTTKVEKTWCKVTEDVIIFIIRTYSLPHFHSHLSIIIILSTPIMIIIIIIMEAFI